jgi:DNA-binding NarL/FixJ family response regulator
VANGESVLSLSAASRLINQVRKPSRESLSPRETEILKLIASGATNREIPTALFISEATVKTHLLHIYEKLGVRDRAAAVGEAFRQRLLD